MLKGEGFRKMIPNAITIADAAQVYINFLPQPKNSKTKPENCKGDMIAIRIKNPLILHPEQPAKHSEKTSHTSPAF